MDRLHEANVTLLIIVEETGASLLSPKLCKSSDLNQLPVSYCSFPGPFSLAAEILKSWCWNLRLQVNHLCIFFPSVFK